MAQASPVIVAAIEPPAPSSSLICPPVLLSVVIYLRAVYIHLGYCPHTYKAIHLPGCCIITSRLFGAGVIIYRACSAALRGLDDDGKLQLIGLHAVRVICARELNIQSARRGLCYAIILLSLLSYRP